MNKEKKDKQQKRSAETRIQEARKARQLGLAKLIEAHMTAGRPASSLCQRALDECRVVMQADECIDGRQY